MFNSFSADHHKAFSQRLCESVAAMGWAESPTLVAREFNLRWRGKMVTVNAVRKWMLGESMPTLDKMQVLADLLGVSQDWLRWGVVQGATTNEAQPLYIKQSRPDGSSVLSLTQDVRLLTESHLKLVQALVTAMLVEQKQKEKVTAGDGE
jgi:transcriptional regulator with XRE-family HTH domain